MNLSTISRYLVTSAFALCLASPNASGTEVFVSNIPPAVERAVAKAVGAQGSDFSIEILEDTHLSSAQSVEAVETAQDRSTAGVRVKLQCVPRASCLPFYVLVRGATLATPHPAPKIVAAVKPVVRAGVRGWCERISGGDMRITVPVVALDSGRVGEVIRVRIGSRQIWHARIISSGLFQVVGDQR